MKKFFKSFSTLIPVFIQLLIILLAVLGHFNTGTISLFEFLTLMSLSHIILIIYKAKKTKTENTQINS